jgi:hypothetical protein
MKDKASGKVSKYLRRVTIAMVASGLASGAHAKPSNNLIIVAPTELPELARQAGEAMFLHQELNGRTLLYVEQNAGTRLAMFDVTDPGHVKAEGSVQLDVPGPFDFVSALGERAELVRFRQGQANAVLDLHKATVPTLKQIEGMTLHGSMMPLGADGFAMTSQPGTDARPIRDYQMIDSANSQQRIGVFEVKRVREELANDDTGTTFLMAEDGLYLVRRPAVEANKKFREQERAMNYAGGGG